MEKAILKKAARFLAEDVLLAMHSSINYKWAIPITVSCDVLAIRRTSYYAWRKRPKNASQEAFEVQAQAGHRRSRRAAGSRTIAKALGVSRWRARKLMQTCQLVSTQSGKPKFWLVPDEAAVGPIR